MNADPIGLAGGVNLFSYTINNPINAIDPLGLNACHKFVDSLIQDWKTNSNLKALGRSFLDKRNTTLNDVTGFKENLISGGQRGAVSRHIYGHAGAVLRYGSVIGGAASYFNQGIDYLQRYQEGRTVKESQAEIAGDIAGRQVSSEFGKIKGSDECESQKEVTEKESRLREKLRDILCK